MERKRNPSIAHTRTALGFAALIPAYERTSAMLADMRTYTRVRVAGARYFFTLTLEQRAGNDLLVRNVDALRAAFRSVLARHPFALDAIVVLPEHLHCLWQLPPDDAVFPMRWRLIKAAFARALPAQETSTPSRRRKGERGIWQRRYWEHLIRDEHDHLRHLDYIHFNPVKHGHVSSVRDWPYSSFHRYVQRGLYPADWGANASIAALNYD